MTRPTPCAISPAGGGRRGRLPIICPRDNVIRAILFYAGLLLIIILFTEEFARALAWLRAGLKRSPRRRLIVYPLLVLLIVVAGVIIVTSLIKFSTTLTFSYD
jgi:H+/Cl- antiporter ClcA